MRDYIKSNPILGWILMIITVLLMVVGFCINNFIMIGIGVILIIIIYYPEFKNPENYKKIKKSIKYIWRL
jgi:membrane-bound ClpP family serine protease